MKTLKYLLGILILCLTTYGIYWFLIIKIPFTEVVKNDTKKQQITSEKLEKNFIDTIATKKHNEITNSISITGIYKYTYEHNTDDLKEDHYIEFKGGNAYYYGTSDDFDSAREGYLPGFFSSRLHNVKILNDKISFDINVDDSSFYQSPITPISKNNKNKPWSINIGSQKKNFSGQITENEIILDLVNTDNRRFKKLSEIQKTKSKFPEWLINMYPDSINTEYRTLDQKLRSYQKINDSISFYTYSHSDGLCLWEYFITLRNKQKVDSLEITEICDHELSIPTYSWKESSTINKTKIVTMEYKESVVDSFINENGEIKDGKDFIEVEKVTDSLFTFYKINNSGQLVKLNKL